MKCYSKFLIGLTILVSVATSGWTADDVAKALIKQAGISQGVCAVIGADHVDLALAIAEASRLRVHVIDTDDAAVLAARQTIDAAIGYGAKVTAGVWSGEALPYADHMIDVLVLPNSESVADGMLQVVRPKGVVALRAPGQGDTEDAWSFVTAPPLEGADNWSHWEHGPDNNPVSNDHAIKAPFITQWYSTPYYGPMPAITTAAGGRTFLAMGHIAHHVREEPALNLLLAQNAYNGEELWRLRLPDGYLAHRSAFVATDDTFHMIDLDGRGCRMLDAATGLEKGSIEFADYPGYWKWMAIQDGRLYALIGQESDPAQTRVVRSEGTHWQWGELSSGYYEKRIPWGFGETLVAYDLDRHEVLWSYKDANPIDSRGTVLSEDWLYFYCPDAHIGSLNLDSGSIGWLNEAQEVRDLIEQPGVALVNTPGFKTSAFCMYTPQGLFYAGQTRNNLVAISVEDGRYMWHKKKHSNNLNMLYTDDKLYAGMGPKGEILVMEPKTGETLENLEFLKVGCTRFTATPDSFFLRGLPDGLTRYDRERGEILYDGAIRPACNDGALAANGLLYLGPWSCDCNLNLVGRVGLASAGALADLSTTETDNRLHCYGDDVTQVATFPETMPSDWNTYRGDMNHTGSSPVPVSTRVREIWQTEPSQPFKPTAPSAAGDLVFVGGNDGTVRAIDIHTAETVWTFITGGPVMQPPTIWNGRAYVGSGDGNVYALEAATGAPLWRFRVAPIERNIMVYGALGSTWPVNSGVLIKDGVLYAAAGIIDRDGTYVCALDVVSGAVQWENRTSGHILPHARKGASASGNLAIVADTLYMASGNVTGVAAYDLATGAYKGAQPEGGFPQQNRGEELAVLGNDRCLVFGGKLRYSPRENIVDSGYFQVLTPGDPGSPMAMRVGMGRVPLAWDDDIMVTLAGKDTPPVAYSSDAICQQTENGATFPSQPLWTAEYLKGTDTLALAVAENSVIILYDTTLDNTYNPRWWICAVDKTTGDLLWRHEVESDGMPIGMLVDRLGGVVVVHPDGKLSRFAAPDEFIARVQAIGDTANAPEQREAAIEELKSFLVKAETPEMIDAVLTELTALGVTIGDAAQSDGAFMRWKLLGPIDVQPPRNAAYEPEILALTEVPYDKRYQVSGKRTVAWRDYLGDNELGNLRLADVLEADMTHGAYVLTEFEMDQAQPVKLIAYGSFRVDVWFNGESVGFAKGFTGDFENIDTLEIIVNAREGTNRVVLRSAMLHPYNVIRTALQDLDGNPIDLRGKQ